MRFIAGAVTALAGATVGIAAWNVGLYLRWRAAQHEDDNESEEWRQEAVALLVFIAHSPIPMAAPMIIERARRLIPEEIKIIAQDVRPYDGDSDTGHTRH